MSPLSRKDKRSKAGTSPGTYKYDGQGEFKGHRFHLRVDSEGSGALLIDASKLLFLNGTAMDYVKCLLEGRGPDETYDYMRRRYRKLDKTVVQQHSDRTRQQLKGFLAGDAGVIRVVGSDSPTVGADKFPAPYRMDIALTYRCQNDCRHCYNATKDKKELSVEQWKEALDKLWNVGVPHIVFTGGEPTLYEGLNELIAQSEKNGQITGVITNGRNLRDASRLAEMVRIGLDHVQITVLAHEAELHDKLVCSEGAFAETIEGLRAALSEDMYVSTNTTIMRSNYVRVEETMRFLVDLGVRNIAFNSVIRSGKGEQAEGITFEELSAILTKLKTLARESGVNLIWYSPTPYCEFNPINYGLGIKQCTACSLNMAVEPDGTVLPCQSYYEPVGSILTDPWPSIWEHSLCKEIRERRYVTDRCADCSMLNVCGGGCPLSIRHGDYVCLDRYSSM